MPALALAVLALSASPDPARIAVAGGVVEVAIGPAEPSVPRQTLLRWVEACAKAVAAYFGRFPVPRVRLRIVTGGGRGVGGGTTWGGEVPSIRIFAGRGTTPDALSHDWVLTHEMVHLAFPDLGDDYSWAEEGLATYVEPIARVRVGLMSEERLWSEAADGLPKGLPEAGDGGLDGTRSWGRTYWGGALFWLMADVEIREKTGGEKGLEDALAGVLAAGGNISADWSFDRVVDVADRAVGVSVLRPLHDRLGPKAEALDVDALLRRLGVVLGADGIRFDERAPLAAVRRGIVHGRLKPGAPRPPAPAAGAVAR